MAYIIICPDCPGIRLVQQDPVVNFR